MRRQYVAGRRRNTSSLQRTPRLPQNSHHVERQRNDVALALCVMQHGPEGAGPSETGLCLGTYRRQRTKNQISRIHAGNVAQRQVLPAVQKTTAVITTSDPIASTRYQFSSDQSGDDWPP